MTHDQLTHQCALNNTKDETHPYRTMRLKQKQNESSSERKIFGIGKLLQPNHCLTIPLVLQLQIAQVPSKCVSAPLHGWKKTKTNV